MKINRPLLEKYVSGQCTPEERSYVEASLQDKENSVLFDEVLWKQWKQIAEQPSEDIDVASSLYRFKEKQKRLQTTKPLAKKSWRKYFANQVTSRIATGLMFLKLFNHFKV